jgi:hypothetical protein
MLKGSPTYADLAKVTSNVTRLAHGRIVRLAPGQRAIGR